MLRFSAEIRALRRGEHTDARGADAAELHAAARRRGTERPTAVIACHMPRMTNVCLTARPGRRAASGR
jgi:hypothetical protein